jgi:hypothetical protein
VGVIFFAKPVRGGPKKKKKHKKKTKKKIVGIF